MEGLSLWRRVHAVRSFTNGVTFGCNGRATYEGISSYRFCCELHGHHVIPPGCLRSLVRARTMVYHSQCMDRLECFIDQAEFVRSYDWLYHPRMCVARRFEYVDDFGETFNDVGRMVNDPVPRIIGELGKVLLENYCLKNWEIVSFEAISKSF